MDNFFLGIQAIFTGLFLVVKQVTYYPVFWGFAMGFFIASVVYGFLITDSPKHVPMMLFSDKSVSFEKIYSRQEGSSYTSSFYDFSKKADQLKKVFLFISIFAGALILISFF